MAASSDERRNFALQQLRTIHRSLPLSTLRQNAFLPFKRYNFPRFEQIVTNLKRQVDRLSGDLHMSMDDFAFIKNVVNDMDLARDRGRGTKTSKVSIKLEILMLLIAKLATFQDANEQTKQLNTLLKTVQGFADIEKCISNKASITHAQKVLIFNAIDELFEDWIYELISSSSLEGWNTTLSSYKRKIKNKLSNIERASQASLAGDIDSCVGDTAHGTEHGNYVTTLYTDFKNKLLIGCHAIHLPVPMPFKVSLVFIQMLSEIICSKRKHAKLLVEIIILADVLQLPRNKIDALLTLLDLYCAIVQNKSSEAALRALVAIAKLNANKTNKHLTVDEAKKLLTPIEPEELEAAQQRIDANENAQIQQIADGEAGDDNENTKDNKDKKDEEDEVKKKDMVSKNASGLTKNLNKLDKGIMEKATEYIRGLNLNPDQTSLLLASLYALRKSMTIAGYTTLVSSIKYHSRLMLRNGRAPPGRPATHTPLELIKGAENKQGERILRPDFREDIFVQNISIIMIGYFATIRTTLNNMFD